MSIPVTKKRPKAKSKVILKGLPAGFLDDLPLDDQRAICAVVGKRVMLNEFDADGRAELEFTDEDGIIHFIYVDPRFIELC